MRRIVIALEKDCFAQEEIKRQFKEETITGKTKLIFARPGEMFYTRKTKLGKKYHRIKSQFVKARVFVIPPVCQFEPLSLPILTMLRQCFKMQKVIIVAYSNRRSPTEMSAALELIQRKPDDPHKANLVCSLEMLKFELDRKLGWIGLSDKPDSK